MSKVNHRYDADENISRARSLLLLACEQVSRDAQSFEDDIQSALLVAIDLLDEAKGNLAKLVEQAQEVVS